MTESQHGFERFDARAAGQERDRGLDVHVDVVVVAIDVVGGFRAHDVRFTVRMECPQGFVRTVLVLVAAILRTDRHPQVACGQRDRGAADDRLGDPLPDVGVDTGIDGDVVRAGRAGPSRRRNGLKPPQTETPPSGANVSSSTRDTADIAGLVLPLAARTVLRIDVEIPTARQAAAGPGRQLVHVVVVLVHPRSALAQPLAEPNRGGRVRP